MVTARNFQSISTLPLSCDFTVDGSSVAQEVEKDTSITVRSVPYNNIPFDDADSVSVVNIALFPLKSKIFSQIRTPDALINVMTSNDAFKGSFFHPSIDFPAWKRSGYASLACMGAKALAYYDDITNRCISFIKRIFSCQPESEAHALNNPLLRYIIGNNSLCIHYTIYIQVHKQGRT